MTYKALVADDEYIIRRGITKFLKKHDNIEVVAEAEDGEMALEMVERQPLDILFVDINMPFLNGLQFIEQVKKIQPNAIVVVITGYDNFEYVRQALRLGVNEYILKPLMENTFDQSLEKVINKIEEKKEEQKHLAWAKRMLKDNLDNLIEEFLHKWVEGHYSVEEVIDKMEYLSIHIPEPFTVTMISLEHIEHEKTDEKWNDDLLYYAADNIVKEIYEELYPTYTCKNDHDNIVLITNASDQEYLDELKTRCKDITQKYLPVKVILLQKSGKEYKDMPFLYQELLDSMEKIIECPSMIKTLKQYIEINFSKEDFSLLEASEYMNLSPQHLSRLFKKEMGITFVDYLTRVRTRKAIELLYQHDMKMYEIAEKVGYASQHYFSSVFKKEMGMSPIDYRKNCQRSKKRSK